MKKYLIIIFAFFLCALPSYGYVWFDDSFDYSVEFSSAGYKQSAAGMTPIPSPFGTNAYGDNTASAPANSEYIRYGDEPYNNISLQNFTRGIMTLEFDIRSLGSGNSISNNLDVYLRSGNCYGSGIFSLYWYKQTNDTWTLTAGGSSGLYNVTSCEWGNIPSNFTMHPVITLDTLSKTYSVAINGSSKCLNINISDKIEKAGIDCIHYGSYHTLTSTSIFYIDNVYASVVSSGEGAANETAAPVSCSPPRVFCDNFNYETPLAAKDTYPWNVNNLDNSVEYGFSPINNTMQLTSGYYKSPRHFIDPFEVNYPQTSYITVKESDRAPVFTAEFKIRPLSGSNFSYYVEDKNLLTVLKLKGVNDTGFMDLYYINSSDGMAQICDKCLVMDSWNTVKINMYFHEFHTAYTQAYWNDTLSISQFQVSVDNYNSSGIWGNFPFYHNESINFKWGIFLKYAGDRYSIDDYYIYTGTDSLVDNSGDYFIPVFVPPDVTEVPEAATGTGDMADVIEGFWPSMGIKSMASRIITSLFLMFILAIILFFAGMKAGSGISPVVLLIIEFFFMVLLVYIKLLDWWLPVIIAILAVAGVGLTVFKHAAT